MATDIARTSPHARDLTPLVAPVPVLVTPPADLYHLPVKTDGYVHGAKLMCDRTIALVALVMVSPILLAVVLAVRLRLGSPVLFRQARTGLHGRPFEMVKVRTMLPDRRKNHASVRPFDGPDRRLNHKADHDPRHTSLGRTLRAWRLDELPQLLHVVRGEMALVGPRPEMTSITDQYEAWQHRRHAVRPGLTGLWQVSEVAAQPADMHLHTDIDVTYVETCSWRTDLRIVAKTIPSMVRRHGR